MPTPPLKSTQPDLTCQSNLTPSVMQHLNYYLVGGAVRDQLLNLPIKDRDYVVVGTTPEHMLSAGFQPVGSDFPVFLHPQTKEEYALARTERKTAQGYHGFSVCTDSSVTLEQDLMRRDLTINAMAMDEGGNIIDPYGGKQDIANKKLRHVSAAFSEDPVRVLRIARFAARFAPLGFSIADETLQLMQHMVTDGELNYLTPERVWQETLKALAESHAKVYFDVLRQCGALAVVFAEIDALFGVPQRAEYHPEIDSGIHTLLSLQQACQFNFSLPVRFAVLVHDLGKALTPKDMLPRHLEHERRGIQPVTNLCQRLKVPNEYRELALLVCKEHLNCHRVQERHAKSLLNFLNRLDALRRPERVKQFVQACMCDAKGRTGFEDKPYPQADYILNATTRIQSITAQHVLEKQPQLTGAAIGNALHQARVVALKQFITQ